MDTVLLAHCCVDGFQDLNTTGYLNRASFYFLEHLWDHVEE